jgi:hypothetical protein
MRRRKNPILAGLQLTVLDGELPAGCASSAGCEGCFSD